MKAKTDIQKGALIEYYLDEHSVRCSNKRRNDSSGITPMMLCERNIKTFLFYHNSKFFMIHYNRCIEYYDRYSMYRSLLKEIVGELTTEEDIYIERGYKIKRDLRRQRIDNSITMKYVSEVNYLYSDGSGKVYGLVSHIPISKKLETCGHKLRENAKIAIDYLTSKGERYIQYINQIEELVSKNYIVISDIEKIKTTDILIRQIKKKSKL